MNASLCFQQWNKLLIVSLDANKSILTRDGVDIMYCMMLPFALAHTTWSLCAVIMLEVVIVLFSPYCTIQDIVHGFVVMCCSKADCSTGLEQKLLSSISVCSGKLPIKPVCKWLPASARFCADCLHWTMKIHYPFRLRLGHEMCWVSL